MVELRVEIKSETIGLKFIKNSRKKLYLNHVKNVLDKVLKIRVETCSRKVGLGVKHRLT